EKKETIVRLAEENMKPVFLSPQEIEDFYEGFCNSTLWPNFHYFTQYAIYKRNLWESYEEVNRKFAEVVSEVIQPEDTVWIHDYQLLLLPGFLREKFPHISIGFFLHIPFPSHEVFRLIPWRKELLKGILGSDLIGFHTYDDMRHFLSAVSRLVFLGNKHGQIFTSNRMVQVDSFPMGIDYDKYASFSASPETIRQEVKFRTSLGDQKLILSIDRLDYSKGIPARLVIFDLFLRKYPEYKEKVSLILLVVPSRDKVEKYKELKEEVDLLVGRINGEYGSMNWTPIHYFYRSLPINKLSALYRMADVALVTPMRDGMNLVCKEFIASKLDQTGVLVLSEMAGASKELSEALIINPNDKHQVADAIKTALEMPEHQQRLSMVSMQETIKHYNVHHWVSIFLKRLTETKALQANMATKIIDEVIRESIIEQYKKSDKRLIFLDYDGTLVPFHDKPEKADPNSELISLLKKLSSDKKNKVVIISGRDKDTLSKWMQGIEVDIIAEHGVWLLKYGKEWEMINKLSSDWKSELQPILNSYVDKTPGSMVEEKDYSLVWHFRKVETGLGELRSREIISHLKFLAESKDLQVLEGNMVVEIKNNEVNKGVAAKKWMKKYKSDFIMAIGDDWTDEDTFAIIPKNGYSIKVGSENSKAKFSVEDYKQVRSLLKALCKS
ncbi:MAG: bifunctional alpha,alpha-trehalose-phosphate synthase (UDP-forming)/trehalose-phosphatase, partial [Cyclobacteriaceae bacterium]|nr:bifunctional alpha,alpha-trehalose-phosphate synthase (UDP-forming)/trehalose-phosphatase [Cyclobacteriaceae bacterium]